MRRLARALLAGAAMLPLQIAIADDGAYLACDAIVRPEDLSTHSRHPWRKGPGIRLPDDIAVCAYYQDEVPGGLSLSVRDDPQHKEFANARQYYREVQGASDVPGEAFYFRLPSTAPFEPSWGLVVHIRARTYRIEGVPEAGDATAARTLARAIIERTMKVF